MAPPSRSPSRSSSCEYLQNCRDHQCAEDIADSLRLSLLLSPQACKEMAATEFPLHCSLAMELFDECWFFHNPFSGASKVSLPSSSPESSAREGASKTDSAVEGMVIHREIYEKEKAATLVAPSAAGKRLERAPSLPSRVARRHRAGRKSLRHTCSNLESFLPSPPFASQYHLSPEILTMPASIPVRQRPPRDSRVLENIVKYVRSNHRAITGENGGWSYMGGKKWRSLSDLDSKEIQGFKDLGFVFDKEPINPSVKEIVQGFRLPADGNKEEEQFHQSIAKTQIAQNPSPPPSLDWFGGSSPADRKHHLRLWAQVVASSVRQEC